MKSLPIRLRLTLWYFFVLAIALLVFAAFIMASLHRAVYRTVDTQLRAHMAAVQRIVNENENGNIAALRHDLDEDVELAPDLTLLEIWGADGHTIYRTAAMNRMRVPAGVPGILKRPATHTYDRHPLRVLVGELSTSRTQYIVMVAIPIHDFVAASHTMARTLWIAIPLLLLLSFAGGNWIAGRALLPVRSMIAEADEIHPGDLSSRLAVPAADDELRRLALTLNRMLARLETAFARITRFTADASHELRTPIALLRARTEVLLRRPRGTEEYRAAHAANLEELERTSALVEKLMLLARADAGAETLNFSSIDLTELVRATCATMEPLARAKQIFWSAELPESPALLRGDEAALRRLLLILIDNAVKYTPEGERVTVSLAVRDDMTWLEVRDTGIGIPEEDIPHVFERFYRADETRARDTGGAGLGLSIARWIVDRHGGTLSVESAPSAGSVFRAILPSSPVSVIAPPIERFRPASILE